MATTERSGPAGLLRRPSARVGGPLAVIALLLLAAVGAARVMTSASTEGGTGGVRVIELSPTAPTPSPTPTASPSPSVPRVPSATPSPTLSGGARLVPPLPVPATPSQRR